MGRLRWLLRRRRAGDYPRWRSRRRSGNESLAVADHSRNVHNVNVTYGPGDPAGRWYNNIGGGIEFTPVQPTAKPHADLSATYGSYNQKDLSANLTSGLYRGWSGVLAAGVGSGNDFRNAPDGFNTHPRMLRCTAKESRAIRTTASRWAVTTHTEPDTAHR